MHLVTLGRSAVWLALALTACGTPDAAPPPDPTLPPPEPTPPPPTEDPLDAEPLLNSLVGLWNLTLEDPEVPDPPLEGFTILDVAVTRGGRVYGRAQLGQPPAIELLAALQPGGASMRFAALGEDRAFTLQGVEGSRYTFCAAGAAPDADDCALRQLVVEPFGYQLALEATGSGGPAFLGSGVRVAELPGAPLTDDADVERWPELAALTVQLSWLNPLLEGSTRAVVVVSRDPCADGCLPSRVTFKEVKYGATSADVVVPEVHDGTFYVTAYLDRDRSAESTAGFRPDGGDLVGGADTPVTLSGDTAVPIELVGTL